MMTVGETRTYGCAPGMSPVPKHIVESSFLSAHVSVRLDASSLKEDEDIRPRVVLRRARIHVAPGLHTSDPGAAPCALAGCLVSPPI